ncbi:MAG: fibronectin type III domain-containing protein [Anaeromyxobacteraceae bacterium]
MKTAAIFSAALLLTLSACGGKDGSPPGAPTITGVSAGDAPGTAVVSFTAPGDPGSSPIAVYAVTAQPGGHTAYGTASPITVTDLESGTAHTFTVVANNDTGPSAAATTGALRFFGVVATFTEPMTQPNDTVFTGAFTWDATAKQVTGLAGTLTQAMTKNGGVYAPPMTTVALTHQRSAEAVTLGGVDGVLVATFALDTTDVFDPGGFAPGAGTSYYGLAAGAASPKAGGVGNAYALLFVPSADPAAALAKAQLDRLAYGDCTAGGMMMTTCMTGTSLDGYGKVGTMKGYPTSQVVTAR